MPLSALLHADAQAPEIGHVRLAKGSSGRGAVPALKGEVSLGILNCTFFTVLGVRPVDRGSGVTTEATKSRILSKEESRDTNLVDVEVPRNLADSALRRVGHQVDWSILLITELVLNQDISHCGSRSSPLS